ncbi:MAG TPA: ATP-binding protein, partial [Coleofasciculaceae cyanobacterium]
LDIPKHINQSLAAAIGTRVLDWRDFSGLERYFAQQLQIYDTVSSVAIATEEKEFLAVEKSLTSNALIIRVLNQSTNYAFHYYAANRQGQRIKLIKVRHDYNPHNDPPQGRPWYQAAQEANHAIWLPVVNLSQGVDHPILTLVNFLPFDDSDGKFQGVLAASFFLPQVANFLNNLDVGQSGQVFIIDRQGLLIASSTGETPFKSNLDSDYLKNLNPQDWRLVAQDSTSALTQASVNFLVAQFRHLDQIQHKKTFTFALNHKRHFLQVNPILGKDKLDWLIITVVPEADFMAQINVNTNITILLCIVALIGSTGIGIFTARWITQPILYLNTAAKDIANGKWEKTVESERFDEVGELAKSFNQMATHLQQSFAELKSLNEALAASENKLNQILEAIPVGVSVHDITGKLIYANQTSRTLLGIEDLPNAGTEHLAEVYQVYQAGTNELYRPETMPVIRSLQGEKASVDDMEIRLPKRTIPLEVYSTPLFDEAGNIVAAIAAFFDITQRKQTEQLLGNYNRTLETQVTERTAELVRANELLNLEISDRKIIEEILQKYERIVSATADGISLIDRNYIYQVINQTYQGWHNKQENEIVGHSVGEVLGADVFENYIKHRLDLCLEGEVIHYQAWFDLAGMGRQFMSVTYSPYFETDNTISGVVASIRNITELKQAATELAHAKEVAETANRAKSQFLANMSHELRTPLNGILGYAQILQGDKDCTPQQTEGVNIIYQCGTHLLTLINDILDLSKIEAEKLELYPEDFDFSLFLQGLSEIFHLKAAQKGINFIYHPVNPLPPVIHADEKRLRQVLMNLLSNAVKFTDMGSVTFQVSLIGNDRQEQSPISKIRFQVEDTGIGILPEQLEKIFLPFEQVGDKSRHAEGTGLGLAITQKIIEMMESQILVESTPKVGSKFWFDVDVPVVSTSKTLVSIQSTDNIIGYSGEPQKILIVDDRWENRTLLIKILERIGFELLEAANGQEGLEKALEFKPNLILSDLVMPIMDGYQMVQKLRQLPEVQDVIIIAISANAFETDHQKSLESGCDDFLAKPIQAQNLFNKIKTYCNLSWIYGNTDNIQCREFRNILSCNFQPSFAQMAIPPSHELQALYQSTLIGDVEGVEYELIRLQGVSPDYISFVIRVLELAKDFQYEKIANLIECYL